MSNTKLCRDWERYIDQELSLSQQSEFEDHLQQCTKCQQRLSAWREMKYEIQAAWLLFSDLPSFMPVGENFAQASETFVQLSPRTLPERSTQGSSGFRKNSRTSRRLAIALVALLLLAGGLGWWGTKLFNDREPSEAIVRSQFHSETLEPAQLETAVVDDNRPELSNISFQVQLPAIASDPQTTKNSTFVQVYPVFEVLELDAP